MEDKIEEAWSLIYRGMHHFVRYDPLIRIRDKDIVAKPVIVYVHSVREDMIEKFNAQISEAHQTGQPIIPVVIDSYGGDAYALLSLISILKSSRLPIATIVEGKAMSCGAILFSCGTEGHRYIAENATVMIHDVSSNVHGKILEVMADSAETERLNKLIYSILARNCGHPDDYFLKIVHDRGHADWYLDAKECIKHNLANHIKVPKLIAKVGVEYEFN